MKLRYQILRFHLSVSILITFLQFTAVDNWCYFQNIPPFSDKFNNIPTLYFVRSLPKIMGFTYSYVLSPFPTFSYGIRNRLMLIFHFTSSFFHYFRSFQAIFVIFFFDFPIFPIFIPVFVFNIFQIISDDFLFISLGLNFVESNT